MSNVLDKSFIHRSYPKLAYGSIHVKDGMVPINSPQWCLAKTLLWGFRLGFFPLVPSQAQVQASLKYR